MIDTIYVERCARSHPRAQAMLERFPRANVVGCEHYGEVFNRGNQQFRLQKKRPALILAHKRGKRVLPVPAGYGVAGAQSYYFSHLLNCPYDCRYCFLQGMFRSAHYVLFVNYEDFLADMRAVCAATPEPVWFYSGYDCDSLALDPVTAFASTFIAGLGECANAWLELRTKSTQIRGLLSRPAAARVVCAYSLNPDEVIVGHEHRAPGLQRRIHAMRRLMQHGWSVALRFDPIILIEGFRRAYAHFFRRLRNELDCDALHSITLGAFRLPSAYAKRVTRMYPEEPLFAQELHEHHGILTYPADTEAAMLQWCREELDRCGFRAPVYFQSA